MDKTPLIRKDSEIKVPIKTRFGSLFLVNVVLCFFTVAKHFHSPILTQYLYMRVKEEVYPNGTESSEGNFTCYKNTSSEDFKLQEKAQQITNTMQMHFSLSKAGFELLVNLVLGSFSDFVGRKVLFVVPLVGYLLKEFLFTAIIYWHMDLKLYYVAEILEGATGGSSLFLLASYACVSDNTPAKGTRTLGMVVIGVTTSLSEAAVSSATGIFIKKTGFFYPSLVSAILMVGVLLAVICILPENVKKKEASMKNLFASCKNVFSALLSDGSGRRKTLFRLAMTTYFISTLCGFTGNIGTLWQLNYPFCWGPEMIGYYSMAALLLHQVLALPLLRLFQMCMSDEIVAVWSCLVTIAANLLQAFSDTNWMMYGVAIIGGLSLGVQPIIRAILSRLTAPDRQGALMASLSAITITCELAGEPMFSFIYKSTIFVMRGVVYLVVASGYVLSALTFTVFAVLAHGHYMSEVPVTNADTIQAPKDKETRKV